MKTVVVPRLQPSSTTSPLTPRLERSLQLGRHDLDLAGEVIIAEMSSVDLMSFAIRESR